MGVGHPSLLEISDSVQLRRQHLDCPTPLRPLIQCVSCDQSSSCVAFALRSLLSVRTSQLTNNSSISSSAFTTLVNRVYTELSHNSKHNERGLSPRHKHIRYSQNGYWLTATPIGMNSTLLDLGCGSKDSSKSKTVLHSTSNVQ